MDVNIKHEELKNFEHLIFFQYFQMLYPSFCQFSFNAYLAVFFFLNYLSCLVIVVLYLFLFGSFSCFCGIEDDA